MKKKFNATQKLIIQYLIALLPLFLYGFYKNGYLLYTKDLVGLYGLLFPIIIPLISFGIGIIIEYLFNRKEVKNSFLPLYALILSLTINPTINIYIYLIILVVGLIVIKIFQRQKEITVNPIAFIKILFFIVLVVIEKNSYSNIYEETTKLAIYPVDMFFGKALGGIATTSIFFCLIGYGILCLNKIYKKEIPLYIIIPYALLSFAFAIIGRNPNIFFELIFTNSVIFALIFITPETLTSPYTKKSKIIYGLLIGIVGFFCIKYISSTDGIFIAILCISLLTKPIDRLLALK